MKLVMPDHGVPEHGVAAQERSPVIRYPLDGLRQADLASYRAARVGWDRARTVLVPPREGALLCGGGGRILSHFQRGRASGRRPEPVERP